MSLVNNMLRDLDQRRKDSDSSGASVRLTPANEFPAAIRKFNPLYVLIFLLIAVIALGFIWLQMEDGASTRTIDSNPTINQSAGLIPAVAEPASAESSPIASNQNLTLQEARPQSTSGLAAEPSTSEPQDILSQAVRQNQQFAEREANSISREQPSTAAPNVTRAAATPTQASGNLDLTSGIGIDESVRGDAEVSEEEQDTIAVQESLRLIANNQMQAAYTNLDTHIQSNRYAHQSRETYAKLLVSSGDLRAAFALIEEGLVLAPNHSGFKKVKARILIQNSQVLDAVELLLTRAPRVAEDVEYHEILASAQLASRDYSGASLSYSELVGVNQTEGKFWYGYAASQELLGNVDVAKQAYTRAVQQSNLSASLRRRSQDRLLALSN